MPQARLGIRRGATLKRNGVSFVLWMLGALLSTAAFLMFFALSASVNIHTASLPQQKKAVPQTTTMTTATTRTTTTDTKTADEKPIVVAYAISLIKCGDKQSTPVGLNDAAVVLRHSIHQQSVRNPESGSKYDYHPYAIVHKQAEKCASALTDAGFTVLVRDQPVQKKDIQGEFLRKHIHREWCCGAAEFIKLYAYQLTDHPIVVHVDIDFIFQKPMDDLFDAMLLGDNYQEARSRVPLERPTDPWPERVDAFMTRDWPQVMPGRKPLFQAGFIVLRPDPKVFDLIVNVIKEGNYVEGFSRQNGWGGEGYGGLVGSMAAQGLIAYIYDIHLPGTWMELNQCRFNHMGMDVLYRSQPSFRPGHAKVGKCRNDLEHCEDCMHTELDKIYNIHYTQCRKPWNCIGVGSKESPEDKTAIPEDSVHLDHCMELLTIWHGVRSDLEQKLVALTGDDSVVQKGQVGGFKNEVFQGHCKGNGGSEYVPLSGKPETMKRLAEIYK